MIMMIISLSLMRLTISSPAGVVSELIQSLIWCEKSLQGQLSLRAGSLVWGFVRVCWQWRHDLQAGRILNSEWNEWLGTVYKMC